jgi:hypothetical protein
MMLAMTNCCSFRCWNIAKDIPYQETQHALVRSFRKPLEVFYKFAEAAQIGELESTLDVGMTPVSSKE